MEKKKLGTICKLRQGFQIPLSEQKTEKMEGYVRFIRIVDYTQNTNDIRYVKDSDNFYYVKPDDVVMIRYGATAGEVGHGISGIIANNMFLIEPNDEVEKNYLYYYLSQEKIRKKLLACSSSTTMPALNFKIVNDLYIPIYNVDKQNELVVVFNKIQQIIKEKEKELDLIDGLVKSRFIELFENAPVRKIEDVCDSFKIGPFGSALHKNETNNIGGYSFVLGTDNAVKNEFAYDEMRYIDESKYKELEKYKVNPGDIIMSMMGTVGRVSVIPEDIGTAIISSHLCILRVNHEIMYPEFFHSAFCKDDNIQFQIDGIHNGSIMKGFNLKIVKAFEIKCPSLIEQKAFMEFKEKVDKSKFEIQQSLDKYQQLFDSLMQ